MSEDWSFQLSVKIEGIHLLNLRFKDGLGLKDGLVWAVENREAILAACAALEGTKRSEPAATPAKRPIAPPDVTEREIGPIMLEGVEIKKGPRDGPPWKSPMYVLKYEGSSVSTFDALNGKAAMGFWTQGQPCYLTIVPGKNPKYMNLTSIRSAAAS